MVFKLSFDDVNGAVSALVAFKLTYLSQYYNFSPRCMYLKKKIEKKVPNSIVGIMASGAEFTANTSPYAPKGNISI